MKTFTARALRLARDYRCPRVGLVLNATRRGAPRGQGGGGRRPRRLHLRPLQAGEGRVPGQGGPAHDPRPPRPPGRRRGAQGPLRLGLGEREPLPRPDQRAGRGGDARVHRRARRRRSPRRSTWRSRSSTRRASRRAATRASCAWARAASHPPRMVDPAPRAAQGLEGDDRPRGQGHHLRLGRHQPEARRPHVGDEGRHGGRGGRALRHARARPPAARRQGGGHPLLRREPARRQRPAARATSSPPRTASRSWSTTPTPRAGWC